MAKGNTYYAYDYFGNLTNIDGSGDGYLRTVCDYVHLNPKRHSGQTMDFFFIPSWLASIAETAFIAWCNRLLPG